MAGTPTLRVDTGSAGPFIISGGSSGVSPSSPRSPTSAFGTFTKDRARSISQAVLPSFRISGETEREKSVDGSRPSINPGLSRARNESRKLLAHILSQLQNRPSPPSLLSTLVSGDNQNERSSGSVIETMKGAVKYTGTLRERRTHQPVPQDDDDSEDDTVEGFTTDATVDLLHQLKDVLTLSIAHNWDIFYDSTPQNQRSNSEKLKDAFRRRSASVGRSRSPSVGRGESEGVVRAPELLSQCISILASIIAEDCRYKVASPRPSRPTYSLQLISLDVAKFLLYTHRHDPRVVSQIGFALLPAFLTFAPEMHTRLLQFFDDGVLGNLLADLRDLQGVRQLTSPSADVSYNDPASNDQAPMVSILVDEVKEESAVAAPADSQWRRWAQALLPEDAALRSTSAPLQDVAIYHLSSVIPTSLAAILEGIDFIASNSSTLYRFHRLLSRITDSKPDAYLDALAIVAYHTPRARYAAISLLLSYWPQSIGHLNVAKAFPAMNYHDAVARETQGVTIARRQNTHPYAHQFVPWRFAPTTGPGVFAGLSQHDCHCCSNVIEGFGLLCTLCMCMVHFDCYDYPEGSFFTEYKIATDPSVQKVAVHRFSHLLPQRHSIGSEVIRKEQHAFRPVSLFSLTLCFVCRKPLWGPVAQAMKCGACRQFAHSSCLMVATSNELQRCRSVVIDDTYVTILWKELRQSFADHYGEIFLTEADLPNRSFEELSVFLAVLWVQLQILNNGLALGSIVVTQQGSAAVDGQMDEFELHYLVNLLEAFLSYRNPSVSAALLDHFEENNLRPSNAHIFFNWNVLAYLTSVIKAPPSVADDFGAGDLLAPSQTPEREDSSYPFEVATLAHLRDQLGDQLNLRSEAAARYLLSQLFNLGFFQRVDSQGRLFDGGPHPERLMCSFPIPMGLEVSTEVETLVAAIEGCLSDIDLSVNEAGLLLLVRRFWPDGMLTEYALRRLSKALLAWILAEDDDLAIMLRDYVAKGLSIPGVRSGVDVQPWPSMSQSRPTTTSSANNGGDYIAGRRALCMRYAARWLLALHDQNLDNYAMMVFDLLVEQAHELPITDEFFWGAGQSDGKRREVVVTEKVLNLILKLSQASVLFTTFDDLFQKWLERASSLDADQQLPLASLSRLFNNQSDTASQRFTTMVTEPRLSLAETPAVLMNNPLKVIIDIAQRSFEGYDMTLHWLCLFVRSGIEISVPTFRQLEELGNKFGVSLEVCSLQVKAALWSCWLKSMGRQDLQKVIANIHISIGPQLVSYLRAHHRVDEVLQVIRQSLAACLLLYGCDRAFLQTSGMILESEIQGLPSRRKLHGRNSTITDPIIVETAIVDALQSYVEVGLEEVCCVVAKFLDAFMHHAALVETFEVDNFVLRNRSALCTCMWQFYAIQASEISTIRTSLLLRCLVVDPQPFQTLLQNIFEFKDSWEVRLQAVMRLFRIVEDVTSPAFSVEDRQWRASVIDVFRYFFGELWEDEREEIRLSVDTWTQTLLGAHFDVITFCWNEALAKSPIAERRRLVSFLNQLRPHFPHWQLLSWDTLLEALLEGEFAQRNGDDEEGPMSAHLSMYGLPSDSRRTMMVDPDIQSLQNSLISLAIRMVAEGIPIDVTSMLKLKDHLAKTLGFAEVAMVSQGHSNSFHVRFGSLDAIPESAYPCLNELMLLLDSSHPYNLISSTMGGRYLDDEPAAPLLVGSLFVDLFLETFINAYKIEALPVLTLKGMLKSLIMVIFKHDFDSRPLKPFQGQLRRAVKRALDLLSMDLSYDTRQLVLTTCHAFIKRWPHLIGNFVVEAIEASMDLMEKMDYLQHGDDILVDQNKNFLRTVLGVYAFSGVFYLLCKRPRTAEFFGIIKHITGPYVLAEHNPHPHENLKDALLRDTLTRTAEGDDESLQTVVENVNTYVEVVHHTDYNLPLMQFVGLILASLTRKTADLHHARFDPSPLLLLACTLIQHNKAHSRDLLTYLETLLRSSLIRFNVSVASLRRILHVTTTLYRRAAAKVSGPNPESVLVNPMAAAMLEITKDALNMKARVMPSTLTALIEALTATPDRGSGKVDFIPLDQQIYMSYDGLYFLYQEGISDGSPHSDFGASQTVANMIMQGAEIQVTLLDNLSKNPMTVRAWNVLALAALSRPSGASAAQLFKHFPTFSLAYNTSLAPYHTAAAALDMASPEAQDRAHADVSHAYAAIKLWLLLARKASTEHPGVDASGALNDGEGPAAGLVWNELWPPFEIVLAAFEMDARGGTILPLTSSLWTAVGDLFLFVRQSRTVVALDTALPARVLNRLKDVVRGESKVTRIVRSLKDPPPDDSLENFINQVTMEITAEEKLQAAKRQINIERRRLAS